MIINQKGFSALVILALIVVGAIGMMALNVGMFGMFNKQGIRNGSLTLTTVDNKNLHQGGQK